MYVFSKTGTVLFVGTHATRRLNGALDCMLSYLPKGGLIPTLYIFFFLFKVVQPCLEILCSPLQISMSYIQDVCITIIMRTEILGISYSGVVL